ncbi:hypothetical protein A2U01_0036743, partial [Trifolium medium]|nr:hypothetical protein [Trifolium medium]
MNQQRVDEGKRERKKVGCVVKSVNVTVMCYFDSNGMNVVLTVA